MVTMVTLICDYCGCSFERQKKWENKNKRHYCSHKCTDIARILIEQRECVFCGKIVYRRPSDLQKSKSGNSFCSKSCSASYSNKLKRKSRRSKMEIQLYEMLIHKYPTLKILNNDKDMLNGLEVDISIPELKLAIEWNGIVHFKPIYGESKLANIQANDKEKLLIAQNQNINLIVIPDIISKPHYVNDVFEKIIIIVDTLIEESTAPL